MMYSIIRSKTFVVLSAVALLSTSVMSCKDNDDSYSQPNLQISEELSRQGIELTAEGVEKQITFTANRKWTATFPSWIDVSPSTGEAGTYTLSVKALANGGVERKGQVLIKFGSGSQSINVVQAGGTNPTNDYTGDITLASLIQKYYKEGEAVVIPDDVTFQAVVISDRATGNTQPKNLHVQTEDAGIVVRFKANHTIKLGSLVNIKAKDAKLQRFNGGALQLELADDAQAVATGEERNVEPVKATIKDIYDGKYENMLVAIENVQFSVPNEAYWVDKVTKYHEISDCVTEPTDAQMSKLSVAISSFATVFKDQTKSDKRGTIIGIVGHSASNGRKHRNLIPRTLDDIKLTEERCSSSSNTGGGGSTSPTTPAAPATGGGHPMITAYVEGASNDKFLQIYNPTDKAIDLSAYVIKLENYSGSGAATKAPTFPDLKLTGTLAPNAVLVLRNSKATEANYAGVETIDGGSVCNFNGNDNVAIYMGETLIDVIGTWGAAWLTADGKAGAGIDRIYKRKASVTSAKATFDANDWEVSTDIKAVPYTFLNSRP